MVMELGWRSSMVGLGDNEGLNVRSLEMIQELTAEMIKVILQERISERILEQILDNPVSEIWETGRRGCEAGSTGTSLSWDSGRSPRRCSTSL